MMPSGRDFAEQLDKVLSCGNAQSAFAYDRVAAMVAARELGAVEAFCERVERRAEENMLKTGKLEGAHYAAMRQVREELRTANTTPHRSGGAGGNHE